MGRASAARCVLQGELNLDSHRPPPRPLTHVHTATRASAAVPATTIGAAAMKGRIHHPPRGDVVPGVNDSLPDTRHCLSRADRRAVFRMTTMMTAYTDDGNRCTHARERACTAAQSEPLDTPPVHALSAAQQNERDAPRGVL